MPQWQEGWKASEKITANRSFVLPVAHDQHLVDSQQGQHCVGPFCCGQGLWFEDSNNEIVTKCEPVTNNNSNKNGVGHTVQKSHLNTQVETLQVETPQAENDSNNDYKWRHHKQKMTVTMTTSCTEAVQTTSSSYTEITFKHWDTTSGDTTSVKWQ